MLSKPTSPPWQVPIAASACRANLASKFSNACFGPNGRRARTLGLERQAAGVGAQVCVAAGVNQVVKRAICDVLHHQVARLLPFVDYDAVERQDIWMGALLQELALLHESLAQEFSLALCKPANAHHRQPSSGGRLLEQKCRFQRHWRAMEGATPDFAI